MSGLSDELTAKKISQTEIKEGNVKVLDDVSVDGELKDKKCCTCVAVTMDVVGWCVIVTPKRMRRLITLISANRSGGIW